MGCWRAPRVGAGRWRCGPGPAAHWHVGQQHARPAQMGTSAGSGQFTLHSPWWTTLYHGLQPSAWIDRDSMIMMRFGAAVKI